MKIIEKFALSGAVLAALLFSSPGSAQAVPDHSFMVKAAHGGVGEVSLGRLAAMRGRSEGVRAFGRRMVRDHSKANHKLMRVALREGVMLPSGPGPEERTTQRRLSRLHGSAFDRAYVQDMVEDHKKDIADFQTEARRGRNQPVKGFAARTLPTLRMHLSMVENLER